MATLSRDPASQIFLRINLRALVRLRPEYEKRAPKIWEAVGNKHKNMLFRRFVSLASGSSSGEGGQWPRLAASTLATKRYRAKLFGFSESNVNRILRLSDTLMRSFEVIVKKNGYYVGIFTDRPYRYVAKAAGPGMEKGIYSRKGRGRVVYCKLTVAQLADVHHKGHGVPRRPIVVKPNRRTFREIMAVAIGLFGNLIRSVNRYAH